MCYSAQLKADFAAYRKKGGRLDIAAFEKLYAQRVSAANIRIPKAIDAWFRESTEPETAGIRAAMAAYQRSQLSAWEQELFRQKKRLADAKRALQSKHTKKADNDRRISSNKVQQLLSWTGDLQRTEANPKDARIYPGHYAPVMVWENGQRVIKPMRYQCRPAGKPALYDRQYPGCYNARRDNLEGFWKQQFGVTHGLMLADAFFENVSRHRLEGRELSPGEREENVVIKFEPRTGETMLVACLWSHWTSPGEPDLLSFAAITDDPPPEVAAAGHDRCIIPIPEACIDDWLNPRGDVARSYAILDQRERPYFEHRLAA